MKLEVVPDDRSGVGKSSKVVRVKSYLSTPDDLDAFTPVYDIASRKLNCTWQDACDVAMVDSIGCNMACHSCYQMGRSTDAVEMSAEEIAEKFVECCDGARVWRLSGGEPALQKDFGEVALALAAEAKCSDAILLINTNGLIDISDYSAVDQDHVVVEISLNGITNDVAAWNCGRGSDLNILDTQLANVKELIDAGAGVMLNLWTVGPVGFQYGRVAIRWLIEKLQAIDPYLPLRVTPVKLKQYDWMPDAPPMVNWIRDWENVLAETYHWTDLAMPKAAWLTVTEGGS